MGTLQAYEHFVPFWCGEGADVASHEEAIKRVKDALIKAGSKCTGGNEWLCPVHEVGDGKQHAASLTVKRGETGNVLVRCAKCDTSDVLELLGLSFADLAVDLPRTKVGKPQVFDYPDEYGNQHLRVERQRYTAGRPETKQKQWTGSRWAPGVGDKKRVLYRLPDLLKAVKKGRTIHLTEGESDADALNLWFKDNRVKEFATAHPEGAGKWREGYVASLAGAERVVVWADRDAPGYACAAKRFSSVQNAGLPVEIRLPIPDHAKADAQDHLAEGHTPDDGKPVTFEELTALTATAPDEEDPAVERAVQNLRVNARAKELFRAEQADALFSPPESDLDLAAALRRPRTPLTYTIDRLHPTGSNSLIAAQYKVGKTTLMANLLASYADRTPFLGEFKMTPGEGRIAFFNYELTADMLYDQYLIPMGIENLDRIARDCCTDR